MSNTNNFRFISNLAFNFFKRLQQEHYPAELHYIHDAAHGQGLLYNGREWNEWIEMFYQFARAVKFVE